jgi:hypothetical protein
MLTAAKQTTAVALRRHKIDALAKCMVATVDMEESQKEIDESTFHHHCEGVYAREYRLPAGHVVIGRVHKYACFNVMLEGSMTIAMSSCEPQHMEAPQFFVSQPGEQKALYAHTDVKFITFHATEETDPDKLLEYFSVPTIKEFEQFKQEQITHQEIDT